MKASHSLPVLLAVFAVALVSGPAQSQAFPSRPMTLVVPFAPGGSTDLLGRAVAERLGKDLGQPVIVENKPGAGTALAAEHVARAAPDGHTMLLATTSTLVLNPLLMTNLRYDAERDFASVSMLAAAPMVMVVNADSPAKSVKDFVELAKAQPGKLNFGSAGTGSSLHMAGELFKAMANIDVVHVPYKGSQAALAALLAGDIQVFFDLIPTSKPLVEAGRLRALAVTSQQRAHAMPDVPTLEEAGFAGYEASPRFALVVPRATPPAVIDRLHTEVSRALGDPALKQQFGAMAMELTASKPQEVSAFFAAERSRWGELIKAKGIRLEP